VSLQPQKKSDIKVNLLEISGRLLKLRFPVFSNLKPQIQNIFAE